MPYEIRDEDGQLMRIVGRQEEAISILKSRTEWSFKCVKAKVTARKMKSMVDWSNFEEALI